MYKCDRCDRETALDESKVLNKMRYVSPSSCYGGDYWVNYYFYFKCECGRPIEVEESDLENPYSLPEDTTPHTGVYKK